MRRRDIWSSLVWLGVGIIFLVGSLRQGLFRRGIPGPGFLPFIIALSLIVLSLMVFFPAFSRKTEGTGEVENFFPERDSFRKILLGLIGLFAYGFALEYTGYIITTFFFMIFASRIMEREKWAGPLFMAVLTAVLSYLLFVSLEVQLPRGVLGI
ncbi:MAG TPA: tripartite tricarboxylate transporter TctB family protein [Thermodesulfobacteriota bacterium]|nr:tripartite tricarboxylate transporter TctB family protein [Thermodesulfobacteriota bacterium]